MAGTGSRRSFNRHIGSEKPRWTPYRRLDAEAHQKWTGGLRPAPSLAQGRAGWFPARSRLPRPSRATDTPSRLRSSSCSGSGGPSIGPWRTGLIEDGLPAAGRGLARTPPSVTPWPVGSFGNGFSTAGSGLARTPLRHESRTLRARDAESRKEWRSGLRPAPSSRRGGPAGSRPDPDYGICRGQRTRPPSRNLAKMGGAPPLHPAVPGRFVW